MGVISGELISTPPMMSSRMPKNSGAMMSSNTVTDTKARLTARSSDMKNVMARVNSIWRVLLMADRPQRYRAIRIPTAPSEKAHIYAHGRRYETIFVAALATTMFSGIINRVFIIYSLHSLPIGPSGFFFCMEYISNYSK